MFNYCFRLELDSIYEVFTPGINELMNLRSPDVVFEVFDWSVTKT